MTKVEVESKSFLRSENKQKVEKKQLKGENKTEFKKNLPNKRKKKNQRNKK